MPQTFIGLGRDSRYAEVAIIDNRIGGVVATYMVDNRVGAGLIYCNGISSSDIRTCAGDMRLFTRK